MARIDDISPGDSLPQREFCTDNVQLFLYNAAIWNAHRIHYDFPYATEVEGYPGLVNAGPLMGDWLAQCVIEWLGDEGRLVEFEYSNRKASIIGETLRSGGVVRSVDQAAGTAIIDLHLVNEQDEVTTPGSATVQFRTN
jgi:hydroxyacyl-ACP dehydratase HTD2-like protein with hotdog domain